MGNPIFKVCLHRELDGNEAVVVLNEANEFLRSELTSRMKDTVAALELFLNEQMEERLAKRIKETEEQTKAALAKAADDMEAYIKEELRSRLSKTSALKHAVFTDYFDEQVEKAVNETLEGAVAKALDMSVRV